MLARIKHFGLQSRDRLGRKDSAEKTQTKKLHGMFHSDEFPEAQVRSYRTTESAQKRNPDTGEARLKTSITLGK